MAVVPASVCSFLLFLRVRALALGFPLRSGTKGGGEGEGCMHFMHKAIVVKSIDTRTPTMLGRSTSDFSCPPTGASASKRHGPRPTMNSTLRPTSAPRRLSLYARFSNLPCCTN